MNGSIFGIRTSLLGSVLLIVVTSLFVATTGQAQVSVQNYNLSGSFVRAEGVIVRLPVIGNDQSANCLGIEGRARNNAGTGATPPFLSPAAPIAPNGCVPGIPTTVDVNTAPGVRGAFAVPTSFFQQPEDNIPNAVLVPIPGIVSLTTDANFRGPGTGPERAIERPGTETQTFPPAAWNQFREGAWSTQSGRAGVNFTWCPENGGCTTVGQGGGGIFKYSNTDPNGFGGTSSVVIAPGDVAGRLPIIQGAGGAFGSMSMFVVPVQAPLGAGGAGPGDLGGKGYAVVQPAMAAGGQAFPAYMLSSMGFLTALTGTPFVLPGSVNTDFHMPFTTGRVLARNILPTALGNPNTFTWTAEGTDARTAMGEGNIQMVSGSLRLSTSSGSYGPTLAIMNLNFVPEPGTLGLIAAGGLFLVGAARIRRS